jgi:hypothetical protein
VVRFLPFLISLVLSVYALFSCIQTRDEDVPYLPKLVWIVLIVFVPFVGPIVWLLMSRTQAVRRERSAVPKPKPTGRPVAPDDDPDFLKSLDRYRDPRTTVRPGEGEPGEKTPPAEKPGAGKSGVGKSGSGSGKSSKDKPAKDTPAKDKSGKDGSKPGAAEEAPTEPDDGKPQPGAG